MRPTRHLPLNSSNKPAGKPGDVGSSSSNQRVGAQRDIFGPNPASQPEAHDSTVVAMQMPARLNPHENGLRRSPRLRELMEIEELRKR